MHENPTDRYSPFITTSVGPKSLHIQPLFQSIMSDREQSPGGAGNPEDQPKSEHLNIKVTDNNNEVFFKIKRTTALSKLMNAFCERQGKAVSSVRFLFDGARVNPTDSPDSVSEPRKYQHRSLLTHAICSSTWPMGIRWRSTKNRLEALD